LFKIAILLNWDIKLKKKLTQPIPKQTTDIKNMERIIKKNKVLSHWDIVFMRMKDLNFQSPQKINV